MRWIENVGRFVFGAECLGCGKPSRKLDPWLCPECVAELERESTVELAPGPVSGTADRGQMIGGIQQRDGHLVFG